MCVSVFYKTFVLNISKKIWAKYNKTVYWSLCTGSVVFVRFKETWIFSTDFRNILRYQISRKSVHCGSRVVPCGQTDRRTNRRDEVYSRFSQFCEAPKNLFTCPGILGSTDGDLSTAVCCDVMLCRMASPFTRKFPLLGFIFPWRRRWHFPSKWCLPSIRHSTWQALFITYKQYREQHN